ncbi:hypothetical protein ASG31_03575 [Chryseobacterium sp. Leaf404]|uniref:META domain-containing protein n=1 Tax=unclassified Chryseobacterium TaxID=2593645 RepID=UPI0006F64091|nr:MULTISPECIES: META domain-containing protein [unclassified Chryseobacterium]KQT22415.1 hypothetical protein ASG31_03575 [Chryseobacterium sp. Leaf404]
MIKIKSLWLTALSLLFPVSCTSRVNQNQNLEREWMMVSFENFSKTEMMNSSAKIIFKKESDTKLRASAKMGCNSLFFATEIRNSGKMKVSDIGSTEMMCKNMKMEEAFLKALPKIRSFKVEGHYLSLSDSDGKTMKFIAADWD